MAHTLPVGSFQTAVQGPRWSREGKPTGSEERQEISVLGEKVLEFAGPEYWGGGSLQRKGSRTPQRYSFDALPEY